MVNESVATGSSERHGYTSATQHPRKGPTRVVVDQRLYRVLISTFVSSQGQSCTRGPPSGGGCAGSNPAGGTQWKVRSLTWPTPSSTNARRPWPAARIHG